MRAAFAALAIASLLAFAGCGGANDEPEVPQASGSEAEASVAGQETETSTETDEPEGPTDEDVRMFVDLISSNKLEDQQRALQLTAPNSSANAALTVWIARDTAYQQAGGEEAKPRRVSGSGGKFKVCSKEPPCQIYAGFKAEGDLIADFMIDGKRMRDRVILGSKKKYAVGGLATARLVGSYEYVSSGGLVIVLEVTARSDVSFGWSTDAYVSPNGTQLSTTSTITPGTLRSGARALVYYYYEAEAADLGGDLYVTAVEDGGAQRDAEVKIPTG